MTPYPPTARSPARHPAGVPDHPSAAGTAPPAGFAARYAERPMPERTDEAWLAALGRAGPERERALGALRDILRRRLPSALRKFGPVPEDLVEDVVQLALLRILDRLGSFAGRSRFTTWALAVASRVALTELRRRRWKDVSLEALIADAALPVDGPPDEGASPETEAARRHLVGQLALAMERDLTPRQRDTLLSELRGMPQEEIGRRLGMSRNAVYKTAHDARRKLQKRLRAAGLSAADVAAAFG